MIKVEFADDSKQELLLRVQSPACDAIPPNVAKAPDLLFSALKGTLSVPRKVAEPPASAPESLPEPAPMPAPRTTAGAWAESLTAVAALRRKQNPLYGMFSARPGPVGG